MKWSTMILAIITAITFGCYQEYNTEVNTDTTVIKTKNEEVDPKLKTYAYYETEWNKLTDTQKYQFYPREIHFITAYDGFTCPPCEKAKTTTIASFKKSGWKEPMLKVVQGQFANDPVYFGYGITAYPTWIIYHRTASGDLLEEYRIQGYQTTNQILDKFYSLPPILQDPRKTSGLLDSLTGIEIEGYKRPYNDLVGIIKQAIDSQYTLNGAATIDLPDKTTISLSRKGNGLQISFIDRKPQARILKGWVKTRLTGITLNKDHADIQLTSFPDLTIHFK